MKTVSRFRTLALTACLAAFYLLTPGAARAEFYALLVGVSDYPGWIDDLQYCDDDARDMGLALLDYPNWDYANGVLLLNSAATAGNMAEAVQELSQRMTADDVFLFYFSGHGSNQADIAPIDEADGLDESICAYDVDIRDDVLQQHLANLPTRNIIVLLDTCFSGGMLKAQTAHPAALKALSRLAGTVKIGDGFVKDLNQIDGLVAISASRDNEYSMEYAQIQNGLFTYFVVKAIEDFVDANGDDALSVEEIYSYLLTVPYFDQVGQHPQIYDGYPATAPASGEQALCLLR